jgi:tetratricopeptide (TPR) repeat protein
MTRRCTSAAERRRHRHPTVEALAELMTAASGSDELRQLLDHHMAVCLPCRRRYQKVLGLAREFGHWDYTVVVAEAKEAPALWHRLEALPYRKQLKAVETGERYQTWALCRLLQRKSGELASRNPKAATELANLAVAISRHLDAAYDLDWIHDLQALAWAYLGNARRELGKLDSSDDAFAEAEQLRRVGTGYPSVEAEALALVALLRRDGRSFAEAAALFERVHDLSGRTEQWEIADPDAEDASRAGEARVHQAWCVYHQGKAEAALALLAETDSQLFARRHDLALAARCGRTWCAVRLGRLGDAKVEMAAAAALAKRSRDGAAALRLSRAQARIARTPAELELAERALRSAAPELGGMGQGVDAALISIDLASLYLARGDLEAVQALSTEVASLVPVPEFGAEGAQALLVFQRACESRGLTPGLAESLAATLERARRPSLAWWASGTLFPEDTPDDARSAAE